MRPASPPSPGSRIVHNPFGRHGSRAGGGAGAIALAAYLDQAFHDPEDLEQFTALPVLATIPLLITTVEQRKQRLQRRFLCTACLLIPSVTIVAVHFFWMKMDVLYTHTCETAELLAPLRNTPCGVSPVSLSLKNGHNTPGSQNA